MALYLYGKDDKHGPRDKEYIPNLHHSAECDVYFKSEVIPSIETYHKKQAHKAFWCATHNQWTYNFPVSVTWMYENEPPTSQMP